MLQMPSFDVKHTSLPGLVWTKFKKQRKTKLTVDTHTQSIHLTNNVRV